MPLGNPLSQQKQYIAYMRHFNVHSVKTATNFLWGRLMVKEGRGSWAIKVIFVTKKNVIVVKN